jgi:hypothetical protein
VLRGLGVEANAWHVLGEYGDEGQPKALIEIRNELVARHLFEFAVITGTILVRQMPIHVARIPPGILQALPEKPRLANAPNFVAPRDDAFLAVLANQFAQCVH